MVSVVRHPIRGNVAGYKRTLTQSGSPNGTFLKLSLIRHEIMRSFIQLKPHNAHWQRLLYTFKTSIKCFNVLPRLQFKYCTRRVIIIICYTQYINIHTQVLFLIKYVLKSIWWGNGLFHSYLFYTISFGKHNGIINGLIILIGHSDLNLMKSKQMININIITILKRRYTLIKENVFWIFKFMILFLSL